MCLCCMSEESGYDYVMRWRTDNLIFMNIEIIAAYKSNCHSGRNRVLENGRRGDDFLCTLTYIKSHRFDVGDVAVSYGIT